MIYIVRILSRRKFYSNFNVTTPCKLKVIYNILDVLHDTIPHFKRYIMYSGLYDPTELPTKDETSVTT